MDTMAMADLMPMATTDTGPMAMDTTMERGLRMPSLLLMLLLLLMLRLLLILGMDTTAMDTGLMPMAMPTIHMAMDTTMARGLLMLRLPPLLMLHLMLMPTTDTMAMADLMPMATTDTGPMAMDTGERSKKQDFCKTAAT